MKFIRVFPVKKEKVRKAVSIVEPGKDAGFEYKYVRDESYPHGIDINVKHIETIRVMDTEATVLEIETVPGAKTFTVDGTKVMDGWLNQYIK